MAIDPPGSSSWVEVPAPSPPGASETTTWEEHAIVHQEPDVRLRDALRVARFWAAALVSDVDEESTAERAYVEAPGWGGPNIWFRGGRGPTTAPNRVHLDLRALTSMSEEVDRLITLGATVVQRYDDITVMQDPEGNEFCVEPGPTDPHQASGR
jgi:Glyoxalase-like domain